MASESVRLHPYELERVRLLGEVAVLRESITVCELSDVLTEDRTVRLVEDDIYSVLPDVSRKYHYDKRAALYDLIVGTRSYNFFMWGTSPLDYSGFARRALSSHPNGRFLDAGCGSLLFTAGVYIENSRHVIVCDQSLTMLRQARRRLLNLAGTVPGNILLLQADLNDLPFRERSFHTILCLNVLHQFENASSLVHDFKKLLTNDGHLYMTSLVLNNRFVGDLYLHALYATGEFVRPRTEIELKAILDECLARDVTYKTKGNMLFATHAQQGRSHSSCRSASPQLQSAALDE